MKTQMYVRPMTEMIRVQTAAQVLQATSGPNNVNEEFEGGGEHDGVFD